jgi:hypothetical protein
MADTPAPVSSAPNQPGQPYDAASYAPLGPWVKLPGGPADLSTGQLTGEDFPDSAPWQQC